MNHEPYPDLGSLAGWRNVRAQEGRAGQGEEQVREEQWTTGQDSRCIRASGYQGISRAGGAAVRARRHFRPSPFFSRPRGEQEISQEGECVCVRGSALLLIYPEEEPRRSKKQKQKPTPTSRQQPASPYNTREVKSR
jgi:hypothetical protein